MLEQGLDATSTPAVDDSLAARGAAGTARETFSSSARQIREDRRYANKCVLKLRTLFSHRRSATSLAYPVWLGRRSPHRIPPVEI